MRVGNPGTLSFLLGDHLGSTSITANSSGSKIAELRYHPWGGTRFTDGVTPTARRFTGQVEDAAIGLYFYNARYYDPYLNRFLSPDTIIPDPANPQSLNRYAYCYNNPLKHIDVDGHFPWIVVGGLVGMAVAYGGQVVGNLNSGMELGAALTTNIDPAVIATGGLIGMAAGTGIGLLAPIATGLAGGGTLATAAGATVTTACADGDCTNEAQAAAQFTGSAADIAMRARVTYDPSLPPGAGATDKLGNITISSLGTVLDRQQALYHEEVHAFFTPRGPLQNFRADLSMAAYQNSHLLRYVEEAIAESRAQILTGGSLQTGLMFPITNGYVEPWRVIAEGGILAGGVYWGGRKLGEQIAR